MNFKVKGPAAANNPSHNHSVTAHVIPVEADGVTKSGGTIARTQWDQSHHDVCEQILNPDNTATYKRLTTGDTEIKVTASITDVDGHKKDFTKTVVLSPDQPTPPQNTTPPKGKNVQGRTADIRIELVPIS